MSTHSLYSGIIRHRRFVPTQHEFEYKIFMFSFDLDHIDHMFNCWPFTSQSRFALGWFKREDYIGETDSTIKNYVLEQAEKQLGFRPDGRVTLLTHVRQWGVLMNPIAVFSCYAKTGELLAVALQVTNTPWGERCLYVLKADPTTYKQHFRFDKSMHVSPFHPMDMSYVCHFMRTNNQIVFHLENHQTEQCLSDATLIMSEEHLDRQKLINTVLKHPYMTSKVYYGIYKQALCLYLKRNQVFDHPKGVTKQQNSTQGT